MSDFWFWLNVIFTVGLVPTHLAIGWQPRTFSRRLIEWIAALWLVYAIGLSFQSSMPLRDVAITLASYSAALFVLLSDMLINGGAAWLTWKRGENWTKEIDYVYLGFGFFGLIASLGKLQNVSGDFNPLPGMLGPMLVATAIVLRAIKTRAEVAGWNKPKRWSA
jgi:hypothetical protein